MSKKKKTPEQRRESFVKKHPKLSATKIYQKWKGTTLGVRKSKAFKLVRKVRKIRAPSKQKRIKSTPKKYRYKKLRKRKPVPAEAPPASEYTVAIVKDKKGNKFWIKYTTKDDLQRQIRLLENLYQVDAGSLEIIETKPYTEFVAEEFKL